MSKIRAKILVVDDEQMLLDLISRILTDEGYEVDTAVDGEKALAKLANNPYDIVLLDIHIPVLSGIEVYEKVRTLYPSSATKYIFMTSVSNYERKELRDSIFNTGVSCITKPFDANKLVKEVNLLLKGEKMNWFERYLNKKASMKLLKGAGTGGLYVGGGAFYILFNIVQFAVPAVVGLAVIWSAIQLFIEGSIIWGLVVLLIGTPIAVGLASWAATFLFFLGLIPAIQQLLFFNTKTQDPLI